MIMVRDSKDKRTRQPMLAVTLSEWRTFPKTVTYQELG
jgi:hypothetical protein